MTTHGHSPRGGQSKTYRAWANMKTRATNANLSYARYYTGIGMCERWRLFANFLADMGEHPGGAETLERLDNSKGYEPGNCAWATRADQSRNRRSTKLTLEAVEMIRASSENRRILAERFGVSPLTIDKVRAHRTWRK